MKKTSIFICAALIVPHICSAALADACPTTTGCGTGAGSGASISNCATYQTSCISLPGSVGKSNVVSCTSCNGAKKLITQTISAIGCTHTYYTCGCTGCTETDWVSVGTGYKQRTGCDNNCKTVTEYKCTNGYVGTPTSATSGCYKCPTSTTTGFSKCVDGTLYCNSGYYPSEGQCVKCPSVSGSSQPKSVSDCTDITQCYIGPGGTYCDGTGCFTPNGQCFYKE